MARRDGALLFKGMPAIMGDSSWLTATPRNAARGLLLVFLVELSMLFQGSSDTANGFAWTGSGSGASTGFGASILIPNPSRKFETLKSLPKPKRAWTSAGAPTSLLVSVVADGSRVGGVKDCGRNGGMDSALLLPLPDLGELSLDWVGNNELSSKGLLPRPTPFPPINANDVIKSLFIRGGE